MEFIRRAQQPLLDIEEKLAPSICCRKKCSRRRKLWNRYVTFKIILTEGGQKRVKSNEKEKVCGFKKLITWFS